MDNIVLGLFLFAAFIGGFASGLAGFAMGFVVSGIWLHLITPIQTTTLIVGYGFWTRLALTLPLACLFASPAVAATTCKPILSISSVREVRGPVTPIQSWIWKAAVVADTRYCATASGNFEIDFIRIKEYAPDVQFTEKYRWVPGQFDVTVELTMDEAIHEHRIGFIAPCVCREIPFK